MKDKTSSYFRAACLCPIIASPIFLLVAFGWINIWFGLLAFAAGTYSLVIAGLTKVSINSVGCLVRLGSRTGDIYKEGLVWIIPLVERFDEVSLKPIIYKVGSDGKYIVDAVDPDDESVVQVKAAYQITIEVIPERAHLTFNVKPATIEDDVVGGTKAAFRDLASNTGYMGLMQQLSQTQNQINNHNEVKTILKNKLFSYGMRIKGAEDDAGVTLTKVTPADSAVVEAMQGKTKEEKQRDAEKVQNRHLNALAKKIVKESGGTLSYLEARQMVLAEAGLAGYQIFAGDSASKVIANTNQPK